MLQGADIKCGTARELYGKSQCIFEKISMFVRVQLRKRVTGHLSRPYDDLKASKTNRDSLLREATMPLHTATTITIRIVSLCNVKKKVHHSRTTLKICTMVCFITSPLLALFSIATTFKNRQVARQDSHLSDWSYAEGKYS